MRLLSCSFITSAVIPGGRPWRGGTGPGKVDVGIALDCSEEGKSAGWFMVSSMAMACGNGTFAVGPAVLGIVPSWGYMDQDIGGGAAGLMPALPWTNWATFGSITGYVMAAVPAAAAQAAVSMDFVGSVVGATA